MRRLALPLALALALTLAGCIAQPQPAPGVAPPAGPGAGAEELTFTDLDTTIITLPAVGGEATLAGDVEAGARWLGATLTWSTRGSVLTLAATSPSGPVPGEARTLAGSGPRSPTRLDWWVPEPEAGAWTFTIRGDGVPPLVNEAVALQLHTARQVQGMHVAQRTEVSPAGFVEVNMEMHAGQLVTYDWTAGSPVYFNIHTHRNGQTLNLVEETAAAMASNFTAEEDGGYSLLWAQEGEGSPPVPPAGARPIGLTYRVDGGFDLHSAVG